MLGSKDKAEFGNLLIQEKVFQIEHSKLNKNFFEI